MKFVCERCHTKYSIADDKVRQKILKIRCKTCENVITIRDAVVVNEPRATSEPRGVRAVPPAPPAPPPRAARPVEWHLAIDGRQEGPLSLMALVSRISAAARSSEIYVWNEQLDSWKEPKAVPEIAAELRSRTAPPPLPSTAGKRLPSPAGGRPAVLAPVAAGGPRRSGSHGTVDLTANLSAKSSGAMPAVAAAATAPVQHLEGFPDGEGERTQIQEPNAALMADLSGQAAAAKQAAAFAPRPSGSHPKTNGAFPPPGGSSSGLEALDFKPGPVAIGGPAAGPALGLAPTAAPSGATAPVSIMGASTSTLLAQVGGRTSRPRHPAFKYVAMGGLLVGLIIVVAVLALSDRDRPGVVGKPAMAEATAPVPAPEAEARARAEAEKYFKSMVGEKPAEKPAPAAAAPVAARAVSPPPRRPVARGNRGNNRDEPSLAPPPLAPPPLTGGAQPADPGDGTSVSRRFAQDERKVAAPGKSGAGRKGEATFDHQKFMGVFKQQDHHTAIKSCYERALKRDERLKLARLDISVNVGETGSVKKVRVDAPPEFNGVSTCIREAVRRWRFPANTEEYEASFPLILHGNAD
jgi:predicted Zn finger-like uncharacterized protein